MRVVSVEAKRVLDPQALELEGAVSSPAWVMETEFRFSARAVYTLNH